MKPDVIITAENFRSQFEKFSVDPKTAMIYLKNIVSKNEIEEKITPVLQDKGLGSTENFSNCERKFSAVMITSGFMDTAEEISQWSSLASTPNLFKTSSADICAAKLLPKPAPHTNKIDRVHKC